MSPQRKAEPRGERVELQLELGPRGLVLAFELSALYLRLGAFGREFGLVSFRGDGQLFVETFLRVFLRLGD